MGRGSNERVEEIGGDEARGTAIRALDYLDPWGRLSVPGRDADGQSRRSRSRRSSPNGSTGTSPRGAATRSSPPTTAVGSSAGSTCCNSRPQLFSFAHGGATYAWRGRCGRSRSRPASLREAVDATIEALRADPLTFDFGSDARRSRGRAASRRSTRMRSPITWPGSISYVRPSRGPDKPPSPIDSPVSMIRQLLAIGRRPEPALAPGGGDRADDPARRVRAVPTGIRRRDRAPPRHADHRRARRARAPDDRGSAEALDDADAPVHATSPSSMPAREVRCSRRC